MSRIGIMDKGQSYPHGGGTPSHDSDNISVTDNMSLMEDAQFHISELLERLEIGNNGGEAAEATGVINSMESMLGSFSENILGMQQEMQDLLESSRHGMLTHERLSDMISTEQVRTNFLVNILGSLKMQIEGLFMALQEDNDDDPDGLGPLSRKSRSRGSSRGKSAGSPGLVSEKVNLMLKSVESLNKLVTSPTKKVQRTITTIDSEVVIHASKLAGIAPTDMAFQEYNRESPAPAKKQKGVALPEADKSQVDLEKELGIPSSAAQIPAAKPQPEPVAPMQSPAIQQESEDNDDDDIEAPSEKFKSSRSDSSPHEPPRMASPVKKKEKAPAEMKRLEINLKRNQAQPASTGAATSAISPSQQGPSDAMRKMAADLEEMDNDLNKSIEDDTSQVSMDSALVREAAEQTTPRKKKGGGSGAGNKKAAAKKGGRITPRRGSKDAVPAPASAHASTAAATANDEKSVASTGSKGASVASAAEGTTLPPRTRRPSLDVKEKQLLQLQQQLDDQRKGLEKNSAMQLGTIAEATAANIKRAKELEQKLADFKTREEVLMKRAKDLDAEVQTRVNAGLAAAQKQLDFQRRELELETERAKIAQASARLPVYPDVATQAPGGGGGGGARGGGGNRGRGSTASVTTDDDDASVGSTGSLRRRGGRSLSPKRDSRTISGSDMARLQKQLDLDSPQQPAPNTLPGSRMDTVTFDDSVALGGGESAGVRPTATIDSTTTLQLNSNTAEPAATVTSTTNPLARSDGRMGDSIADSSVGNSDILDDIENLSKVGFNESLAEKRKKKIAAKKAADEQKAAKLAADRAAADAAAAAAAAKAAAEAQALHEAANPSVVEQAMKTLPPSAPGQVDPVDMVRTILNNTRGDMSKLQMVRISAPLVRSKVDVGTCTALDGMNDDDDDRKPSTAAQMSLQSSLAGPSGGLPSGNLVTGLAGVGSTGAPLDPPGGVTGKGIQPISPRPRPQSSARGGGGGGGGESKDPETAIQEYLDSKYQTNKQDLLKSYEVAKSIMRRSFDKDTYAFLKEKIRESAVDGVLGPDAHAGGLFELPIYDNRDNILVTRTYKKQPVPGSFMDTLSQSDFPLYILSEEYAPFLPHIHRVRLQTAAMLEDRLKELLPTSNALQQLLASLLENMLRVSTDCDKMLKTLDACEGMVANLVGIVKANPGARPMIAISVQMSDLHSNFGEIEASKISVDLQMFEYRAMFERVNAVGMRELATLMKESSDFEYCYKYFIACQGKTVEIQQRLAACKERCRRNQLMKHPGLKRGGPYENGASPNPVAATTRAASTSVPASNPAGTASGTDPGGTGLETNSAFGMSSAGGGGDNEAGILDEMEALRAQVAELQEDVETLQEELEDHEVELLDVMKEKDKAPDALSFFAIMHDPSAIQNLQQLTLQLKALRAFVDGKEHMDFITLRKRLQVCVTIAPGIEKLCDKYGQMYGKWSKFRLNWFAERKLTGGAADNFGSCPLCFTRLGAPTGPPPGTQTNSSKDPSKSKLQQMKDRRRAKKQQQAQVQKQFMSQSMSPKRGGAQLHRGGATAAFDDEETPRRRLPVTQKHQINLPSIS